MDSVNFNEILCPIDFSKLSVHALHYAVKLSEQFKSKLYVIHVIPLVTTFSRTAYFVDEHTDMKKLCSDEIPKGISYESEIIKNDEVYDGITEYAKEKEIDLIVMGTHGHSSISRVLLGSTTEEVSRKATCPVMLVREIDHS
ncbi:MAG: universal stress protein [Spirochaetota bacterium]|nr:universal stress protein [Spirochaetota bacterium]